MPGDVSAIVRTGRGLGPAGLTLIEFLFAVSVFAITGLGVAGMFPAAFRSVVVGGQVTKATILAQEMADMIRADTFTNVSAYINTDTRNAITCPTLPTTDCTNKLKWKNDLSATTAQSTGQGLPSGYGTVVVVCVNADGTTNTTSPCPTDLRKVTVTVTWDRQGQGSRSVSLVSYVARTQ